MTGDDIFCGIDWATINAELDAHRDAEIALKTSIEYNDLNRPLGMSHEEYAALDEITTLAQMLEWYNAQAAQRKARMGRDYWDRRLDRAPLVAACPRKGAYG